MTDAELVDGILRREGDQYTDRPADRGGPTKYGITLGTLSAWRGAQASAADVQQLTRGEAAAIYQDRYVSPWAWVPEDRVRQVLVDWSVTSGPDRAARALQGAVGCAPDGKVGPATRSATRAALASDAGRVLKDLVSARVLFLAHAAVADRATAQFMQEHPESQLHNLTGWLARALALL